jgi:hypothetical protein
MQYGVSFIRDGEDHYARCPRLSLARTVAELASDVTGSATILCLAPNDPPLLPELVGQITYEGGAETLAEGRIE